jgi:ketosteroid isomerase-like protein
MAIRTNPSYATAHENLGDVYAKLASQAYNKALQLDASNPAVPPKLALIRELFSASGAKGQRPASPAAATTTLPAPATAVATAPTMAKPPPTLPGPVLAKPATPAVVATVPTPAPAAVAPVVTAAPVAATPAQTQTTPAPSANTSNANNGIKEAEAAVRAWASAWASKDVKSYLAAYGKDFDPPGSMKRHDWEEERRQRISSKSKISVKLDNLNIAVNGNKATAKFRQDYKAGGLAVSSHKTLELVKTGDRWQIVKETTAS